MLDAACWALCSATAQGAHGVNMEPTSTNGEARPASGSPCPGPAAHVAQQQQAVRCRAGVAAECASFRALCAWMLQVLWHLTC